MNNTIHVKNTPDSQHEPNSFAEKLDAIHTANAIGRGHILTGAELKLKTVASEKNILTKWDDFKKLPPPTSSSFRPRWRSHPTVSDFEIARRIANGGMDLPDNPASEW